ncbi:hypothetical protein K502DRAFT_313951 [Neoconidiobolus thromboides FSU 785]|nr:hypothetical protein K502DRAFT_313951 [Neoconidiobolus thromboides FSU 785]
MKNRKIAKSKLFKVQHSTSTQSNKLNKRKLTRNVKVFLFLGIFIYRLLNSYLTKSYFIADEYWQSYEIAFEYTYGYGYLTWEWAYQLRSFFYPWLLVIQFKLINLLNWNQQWLLVLPKVTQSLLAAMGDYYVILLSIKLFGINSSLWALLITLTNWFNLYLSCRLIPNNIEGILTIIALYYWPMLSFNEKKKYTYELSLSLAGLTCLIRPTSVILWLCLGCHLLFNRPNYLSFKRISISTIVIVLFYIIVMLLIDYCYYQQLTFIPYNFYKFNIEHKIANHYGVNQWYFYLLLGLPGLCGPFIYFLYYLRKSLFNFNEKLLLSCILLVIIQYSLVSHKELRFIYQIHYIMLIFLIKGIMNFMRDTTEIITSINNKKQLIILLTITNFLIVVYLNLYHQVGVINIMTYLRNNITTINSIGFLMPCHSTPYYSTLMATIPMWFITCNPPLTKSELINYHLTGIHEDISDVFYQDPYKFIINNFQDEIDLIQTKSYPKTNSTQEFTYFWPSHLVLFEALLIENPKVKELILKKDYHLCYSTFNSLWHDDHRRNGKVILYCRK